MRGEGLKIHCGCRGHQSSHQGYASQEAYCSLHAAQFLYAGCENVCIFFISPNLNPYVLRVCPTLLNVKSSSARAEVGSAAFAASQRRSSRHCNGGSRGGVVVYDPVPSVSRRCAFTTSRCKPTLKTSPSQGRQCEAVALGRVLSYALVVWSTHRGGSVPMVYTKRSDRPWV